MAVAIEEGLPPKALWPERLYTLPETRYPVRLNVATALLDANADGGRAGRPAIHHQGQVLTYGELQKRVNRLANGLRAAGVDRGDRVLLRMPNCPEFIVTWLACQKLGVVTVSTMPLLRARELSYIAQDAGTRVAVVSSGLREELERARPAAPVLEQLIVVGETRPGDLAWASLLDGQPERFQTADTRADDVAMIAYTSGSTGVPKGCVHDHTDILGSADSYARYVLQPCEEDRFGGHPTLAFTFGTGGLLVFPFRFGAATVLSGPFDPERNARGLPARPRDRGLLRVHVVPVDARGPGRGRAVRPRESPPLRLRRRAPARRDLRGVGRHDRQGVPRRDRLDRDVPHLRVVGARPGPPGRDRRAGARLRLPRRRRGGPRGAPRDTPG